MPFQVKRLNVLKNETDTAAQQYATKPDAFDAAWDNCGTFVKNNFRAAKSYGDLDGPSSTDKKLKILIEHRSGESIGVMLRYSFPTGTMPVNPEGTWDTNEIRWQVIEI